MCIWVIVPLCILAIVSLCIWAVAPLCFVAIVSLEFVPLCLWSLCYRDSGRLGYCYSGSLGYCDYGVWAIVNSGGWALAALFNLPLCRYLFINSSFGTNCILWNVFLIEGKIWSKTLLQASPSSKEKGSSQRDKIHRDNQVRQRRQV